MAGELVLRTIFDPAARGNAGRFCNHSCEPNLAPHPVRVGSAVPRLALFALRDVAAGEELTFAYGDAADEAAADADATPPRPCLCGAAACRGALPFDPAA